MLGTDSAMIEMDGISTPVRCTNPFGFDGAVLIGCCQGQRFDSNYFPSKGNLLCGMRIALPLNSHSINFLPQRTARRVHASVSSWLGFEVARRRFRLARASFGPSGPARGRSG